MVSEPDLNVTVGWEIVSFGLMRTVIISVLVAQLVEIALLEEMLTLFGVGEVLSNATLPLPLVTGIPVLPAMSLKLMVKVTLPSVSLPCAV